MGKTTGFLEFSRRQGDFAIAAVAAVLELDSGGACTSARIGLGGVAPAPVRALAAERALVGRRIDGDAIDEAILVTFVRRPKFENDRPRRAVCVRG